MTIRSRTYTLTSPRPPQNAGYTGGLCGFEMLAHLYKAFVVRCGMTRFEEGELAYIVTEWRDVRGKVNPRGEVVAVLAVVAEVLPGGKTAKMEEGFKTYTLPLIEGFAFRGHS